MKTNLSSCCNAEVTQISPKYGIFMCSNCEKECDLASPEEREIPKVGMIYQNGETGIAVGYRVNPEVIEVGFLGDTLATKDFQKVRVGEEVIETDTKEKLNTILLDYIRETINSGKDDPLARKNFREYAIYQIFELFSTQATQWQTG